MGKLTKLPEDMRDRRFNGFIKHIDKKNNFGFLENDETRRAFERDIFVDINRLPPGADRVGDPISFELIVGRRGYPEASACESK